MSADDRSVQVVQEDKPKRKSGVHRNDWETIMHDYVTNPEMTMRKVCDKYNVSYDAVRKQAKKNEWYAQRKKAQQKVVSLAISKTITREANRLASEMEAANRMSGAVLKALRDPNQFNRHLVQTTSIDQDGQYTTTEEKIFEKLDTKAMRDLAAVMKTIEDMKRSLYHIEKADAINKRDIEQARLDLERERFEFEKEKEAWRREQARQASAGSGDEDLTGVVLIPEVLSDGEE